MSQFISYTAWFNIFALALNLANDPYLHENVRFRPRWAETGEVNLLSKEGRQTLIIDVFDRLRDFIGSRHKPGERAGGMSEK